MDKNNMTNAFEDDIISDARKATKNWNSIGQHAQNIIMAYIKLGTIEQAAIYMDIGYYDAYRIISKHAKAAKAYKRQPARNIPSEVVNHILALSAQGYKASQIVRKTKYNPNSVYSVLAERKPRKNDMTITAPSEAEGGLSMLDVVKNWAGCEVGEGVEYGALRLQLGLPKGWRCGIIFGINRVVVFDDFNQKRASWSRFDLDEPARIYQV